MLARPFIRRTILAAVIASAVTCAPAWSQDPDEPIDTIAFGSCLRQDRAQPVWDAILAEQPDLFLFIGDNMYADLEREQRPITIDDARIAYGDLGRNAGFARLRTAAPILATWDDHDYGLNDSGVELPYKHESQRLLLRFFNEPLDSPRWTREGVYHAQVFGPEGRRVQVILLDTRYFRDALVQRPPIERRGRGPYMPTADKSTTLLGEAQWQWLGEVLREPADLRIIASSIQVIADEHGWECWGNFPHERDRLYQLIRDSGAGGVIFISGDRHHVELSREDDAGPYPLYDFTSSGLNEVVRGERDEPNAHRIGKAMRDANYGLIRIDWDAEHVRVHLEGRGLRGQAFVDQSVDLDTLRAADAPP
jgi:alkaline phosphatase D